MFSRFVLIALFCGTALCVPDQKAHLSSENSAKLLQHGMKCMMDTGVSPDAIVMVKSGKFSEDESFKKFLYCVLRKSNVVTKDGNPKIDNLLSKYPENVDKSGIRKVLEVCKDQKGKDGVDKTFKVFKCFHEKTPVHLEL